MNAAILSPPTQQSKSDLVNFEATRNTNKSELSQLKDVSSQDDSRLSRLNEDGSQTKAVYMHYAG